MLNLNTFLPILFFVVIFLILIFRKRIFPFYYRNEELRTFYNNVQNKLKILYPNIKFELSYIKSLDKTLSMNAKKYLILDDAILQYINYPFKPTNNKFIPQSSLWSSYTFNSKTYNKKLPEDWLLRKGAIFERDEKKCKRCGKIVTITECDLMFVKSLENGGDYYLENMILVCNDCSKIEHHKKDETINIKYLNIKTDLYGIVK
ncbi:MAG: HNH endonuclease [Arcobacter sp.]|nr:HNH endonuclease [Arcobacter sp.]